MMQLVISLEANRDLSEICDYFLETSVDAGDRFVAAFEKKCQHLANYPYLGRSYQEIVTGLRGLPLLDLLQINLIKPLGTTQSCTKQQLNYNATHNDDDDCGNAQPGF